LLVINLSQVQLEAQKRDIVVMAIVRSLGCLYCKYIIEDILHRKMMEKNI